MHRAKTTGRHREKVAVCELRGGAAGEATLLTPCSPGEVDGDFPLLLKKKKRTVDVSFL